MNVRPDAADTEIFPLLPVIEGVNKSVAVSVWVPSVTNDATNVPTPLVSVRSGTNSAKLSLLPMCTGSENVVTVLLPASRAVIVNLTGTPAVTLTEAAFIEKCVAVAGPPAVTAVYVAMMVSATVPEFRIRGLLWEDTPLTVTDENPKVCPPLLTGSAKLTEHETCVVNTRFAGVVYVPGAQPVPVVVNEAPDTEEVIVTGIPAPSRILTLALLLLPTAKSALPSPLKSPITSEIGAFPAGEFAAV